jgi:molybdopterin converting factor small subunit
MGEQNSSPLLRYGAIVVVAMVVVGGGVAAVEILASHAERAARSPGETVEHLADRLGDLLRPNVTAKTVVFNAVSEMKKHTKLVVLTAEVTAEIHKENTKTWLGVNWGTTTVDLKAPGKVQYFVPLEGFGPQNIAVAANGRSVVVRVPGPVLDREIVEVESDPAKLEVRTEAGWARLASWSGQALEDSAKAELRRNVLEAGDAPVVHAEAERVAREAVLEILKPLAEALKEGVEVKVEFEKKG